MNDDAQATHEADLLGMGERLRQVRVGLELLVAQLADDLVDGGSFGAASFAAQRVQQLDQHVAVAALAERTGEFFHIGERGARRLAREAGAEDLEGGAQAPRRDSHLVHALRVIRVKHAFGAGKHLAGARPNDRLPRLAVGLVRAQLDVSHSLRPQQAGRVRADVDARTDHPLRL